MRTYAREITNRIFAEITKFGYESNKELDAVIFEMRLEALERCLQRTTISEQWRTAMHLATLWMPLPNTKAFKYDSVEYNTVEAFCLCVRKAFDGSY